MQLHLKQVGTRRTRDAAVTAPSDDDGDNSNKENTRLQLDLETMLEEDSATVGGKMSMPSAPTFLPNNPIVRKRKLTRIMKRDEVAAPVVASFADLEDE